MAKNPPEGSQRLVPMLAYADAPGAIEFLCRAFGFEERSRMEMPDGRIGHAELGYEESVVMLASAWREAGMASPLELAGVPSQIQCYVDDVDAHFRRAKEAGATVIGEPADQFYGARTYRALDLEGHRWTFATQFRDFPPAEPKKPD